MSITVLNTIPTFSPSYNPLYVVMNSTNKLNVGFNYIVDIYKTGTSTLIRRLRVQPNELKSYYGYADVSKSLSTNLYGDPMTVAFSSLTENTYQSFKYTLKLGEEYQYTWDAYDNFYSSEIGYENHFGLTSHTAHKYAVGDYIFITQQSTHTYDQYEGAHQVVAVPNSYSVVLNYQFMGNTPAESATTRFLSYKKVIETGLTTVTGIVWDGAVDYDFYTYNWMSATTYPAVPITILPTYTQAQTTGLSNDYKVRITNNGFFNIYQSAATKMKDFVVTKNDGTSVDLLGSGTGNATTTTPELVRVPFTPAAINSSLGYNWISGDTTYYNFYITETGGTNILEAYWVQVDNSCLPAGNIELLFEDQLGSYIPINFRFINKETLNVTRSTYKKYQEYELGTYYTYDPTSQTNKINAISLDEIYGAHTGWVGEDMVAIIEGLLTSKNVYINYENSGVYYPVEIVDTTFDRKTTLRNKLIDYTIQYKISNTRSLNI